jgi:hypothetical protein
MSPPRTLDYSGRRYTSNQDRLNHLVDLVVSQASSENAIGREAGVPGEAEDGRVRDLAMWPVGILA